MLFVGTSIIHPSTEGVFLLCNILDLLIYRFKKKDSKELLKRVAKIHGCSVSEIREEMQYAIEEARNNDDPDKQAEFQRLFGNRTPSPEEFIYTISKKLKV